MIEKLLDFIGYRALNIDGEIIYVRKMNKKELQLLSSKLFRHAFKM